MIEVPKRKVEQWEMDDKAYVLVRIRDKIEVRVVGVEDVHRKGGFSDTQKVLGDYKGDTPEDLYYKIIADGWITNLQHAAYLGSELRKAYIALKEGKKYNQDQ